MDSKIHCRNPTVFLSVCVLIFRVSVRQVMVSVSQALSRHIFFSSKHGDRPEKITTNASNSMAITPSVTQVTSWVFGYIVMSASYSGNKYIGRNSVFLLSGAPLNFAHPALYHNFGDGLLGSVIAVVILWLLLLFGREKLLF